MEVIQAFHGASAEIKTSPLTLFHVGGGRGYEYKVQSSKGGENGICEDFVEECS